jgi:hypothetical protein
VAVGGWWKPAAVSSGVSLALACSLLVAPTATAQGISEIPPETSTTAQAPETARKSTLIDGQLETPPTLSLSGHLISPGRPGGQATVDVVLASTTRGGKPIKGLQVRIAAPEETSFAQVGGKGWRCAADTRVALCSHERTLGRDDNPPHIRATLDISESFSGSRARIHAWSRWKGEKNHRGSWIVSERSDLPIYPRATLSLSPSAPVVTVFRNGSDQQRQFQLTAEVGQLEGLPASLTWRQVSGPKVLFLSPEKIADVDASAEQLVQVTTTPREQRYVFAARVVAQGQVVEKRVSVMTRGGVLLGEVDAATPSESTIAESTELAPLEGAIRVESRYDLRIDGPTVATNSTLVRLRAAGTDARRGTLRWTVDGRAAGTNRTLQIRAPAVPGDTVLVELRRTLPSGALVVAGHVLAGEAGIARQPRQLPVPRSNAAFCTIARGIDEEGTRTLDLGSKGEQRFTFRYENATIGEGVFDAAGSCTGSGEIAITGASLNQSPNVRLADVTATLSPSGLTITQARMTVKSTASNALTDKIGLDLTGTIESRLSSKSFGLAEGSATFDPVSIDGAKPVSPFALLLDEPEDWEFLPESSKVTFGTGLSDSLAVRLTQVATSAPNAQGTRGTVALSIDILGDEPIQGTLSVANLTLGETPKGGLIMVESARVEVVPTSDKKGVDFTASLPVTCQGGWEAPECAIFAGFRFSDITLNWTKSEKTLAATAAIAFGGNKTYALTFRGAYRGERDWDIKVENPKDWELGQGMTFSNLRGSVVSKPQGESADITMSITGTFSGLALGGAVTVREVTPRLTNECPADAPAECSLAEMKLFLTASLQATLPGRSTPASFEARADINLATLNFAFESGVSNLDIGPEELRLKDVKLVISRGAATACTPTGTDGPQTGGVTVRFTGTAEVLQVSYSINVQSDSRGLCLWGSGDTIALGGGLEAVSPILAYTTYADGATVDDAPYTIDPNRVILTGGFLFPDSLKTRFGIPGEGVTFKADLATDLTKASFQVQYNADGEVALYRGDGAALLLEGIGFGLDLTMPAAGTPEVDAYFFGRARLDIEGSPSSSTPLEVRIGVKYSGAQFKIAVQGGLVSGGAQNAFGVEGLTVRQLSVSAEFDIVTTTPTLGLNADVSLPAGWMPAIGIADGTPVALAASLDAFKPCLRFSMGTKDGADFVDFGGVGFLTANYMQLLLAPTGCTVPQGATNEEIPPGWAVDVRGRALGSPVTFAAGVVVRDNGIEISAELRPPLLEFYGVTLRGKNPGTSPMLTFFMDTATDRFEATVDAGLEIGNVRLGRGLLVEVEGEIRQRADFYEIDLEGVGDVRLGPVSLAFDPVEVDVDIPRLGSGAPLRADIRTTVKATLDLGGLGSYTVTASGRLKMTGATVSELAVSAGGNFDAKIYELNGTIAFNLCAGTLSPVAADGTGSVCTEFGPTKLATSSPAIRVSAYGTQKWALRDPKPFTKVFYEREGVEG